MMVGVDRAQRLLVALKRRSASRRMLECTTSAFDQERWKTARPSGVFRSMPMLRLPAVGAVGDV